MEFGNPVIGLEELIRSAIRSKNFLTGVSGWRIARDGSAEFNNVIIRGGIIISGSALYYSGAPAFGSLVASISAAASTDVFGNGYLQGFTTYDHSFNSYANLNGNLLSFGLLAANIPVLTGVATLAGGGGGLDIISQGVPGVPDGAKFSFAAGLNNIAPVNGSNQAPNVVIKDINNSSHVQLRLSGAATYADATLPGLGNNGKIQPLFNAGWAQGPVSGNTADCKFWLDIEDNLIISGACHSTSATPNATMFTLDPNFFNTVEAHRVIIATNNGGVITQRIVTVNTTGAVTLTPNVAAASTDVYFQVQAELGNIF